MIAARVSYTHDLAGRLASLNSLATTYAPAANVTGVSYAPHGALASQTLGNNRIHAQVYNNRLQPTAIKLGTAALPTSVMNLTYNYGTTTNNGNVQSLTYTGGGLSYTQTFGYDQLNRLTTSQEGASWSQTNSYDRYGNRSIVGAALTFNASNNRITTVGYTYDLAGNLTDDGPHAYTFDAENKISKVDAVSAYVYDGEGQRVRKLVNENLRFIYGVGGRLIAEYSGATGMLQKEYIYGASGLVATVDPTAVNSNGTRYTTSDHLGSPRVVTNSSGGVVSRHDYMPFGEEIFNGGRTVGMGYAANDGVRQQFTSKERDNETGLDYSGARYYSSTQGRFTRPDQPFGDQEEGDPQSWNLYSYVRNNPLRFIDPSGLARQDGNGNWVGEKDGECDKGMGACWRVDADRALGGYWDFGGNQSPVTIGWTDGNEAALQATIRENFRRAALEGDPDCEGCAMEAGGGRLIVQALKVVIRGRPTSRLDRALRYRGFLRGVGTHAHHIVASRDVRAGLARRILSRFRIDVDAAENGIYLPAKVHQGLHSNAYYERVGQLLSAVASKEEAVAMLSFIGSELQKGTFLNTHGKFPF